MALPIREYFYLEEVAKRWAVSTLDIQYYIENGLLETKVWLRNIIIEFGCYESTADGQNYPVTYSIQPVSGLYALLPDDCRIVFRKGKVVLNYLCSHNTAEYCKVQNERGIKIKLCDLVVTAQACMEFEMNNGICECALRIVQNNTDFQYHNNFSEVTVSGFKFYLGTVQANVVKILYQEYIKGSPWVYGKEVLRKSSAETMRMVDLFKSQDNWRELILSNGKGYYRLNIT